MTEIKNRAISISNPTTRASRKTALPQVSILSIVVGDRKWQNNNQKNLVKKVRLDLLIRPKGSNTQFASSPSMESRCAIHLLVDSLSSLLR